MKAPIHNVDSCLFNVVIGFAMIVGPSKSMMPPPSAAEENAPALADVP